ncbi:MAG TPA: DUF2630 family protein [Acidimicrobiales bacterium]|nr:DUF2630 family protein [Acidimicrobiales bacterium]
MDDQELIRHIGELADQERQLEERHTLEGLSTEEKADLDRLEVTLDQLWDLLRQRRALRAAGRDPDDAHERSGDTVERYWQ